MTDPHASLAWCAADRVDFAMEELDRMDGTVPSDLRVVLGLTDTTRFRRG